MWDCPQIAVICYECTTHTPIATVEARGPSFLTSVCQVAEEEKQSRCLGFIWGFFTRAQKSGDFFAYVPQQFRSVKVHIPGFAAA